LAIAEVRLVVARADLHADLLVDGRRAVAAERQAALGQGRAEQRDGDVDLEDLPRLALLRGQERALVGGHLGDHRERLQLLLLQVRLEAGRVGRGVGRTDELGDELLALGERGLGHLLGLLGELAGYAGAGLAGDDLDVELVLRLARLRRGREQRDHDEGEPRYGGPSHATSFARTARAR